MDEGQLHEPYDLERLPHREPFLFLTQIVEVDAGQSVKAIYKVREDHIFYSKAGQAPGWPNLLVVESMAQAGGFLAPERPDKTGVLMSFDGVLIHRGAVAGETLRLEAKTIWARKLFLRCHVSCLVEEELIACGDFSFAYL